MNKVPVHDLAIERSVLASMITTPKTVLQGCDLLTPEYFYASCNKMVFAAIQWMSNRKIDIDISTLGNTLSKRDQLEAVGGYGYISELVEEVSSVVNIKSHAEILINMHVKRSLAAVAAKITDLAFNPETNASDIAESAERHISESIKPLLKQNSVVRLKDCIQPMLEAIEANKNKKGLTGYPTGLELLDEATCGLQGDDLIIVGARPGMGKSAFALTIAKNAAIKSGKSSLIFTCEMSSLQLCERSVSSESGLNIHKIRSGRLNLIDMESLNKASSKIYDSTDIFIDDTPGVTVFDVRAKTRQYVHEHGISAVFIDYLGLMGYNRKEFQNKNDALGFITKELKNLAKEMKIPIIVLCQLSRSLNSRPIANYGRVPVLSDLRDSGEIEQDADIVMFLYRDEEYDPKPENEGKALIVLAKYRNGPVCRLPVKFVKKTASFTDLTTAEEIVADNALQF